MFLLFSSFIFLSPVYGETPSSDSFSVIWVTDTQYLSARLPDSFDKVCSWITNNSVPLNLKAVIHTGDIVDNADNLTEWDNANHSMSILLDNNIPYSWDAGNHDQLKGTWNGKNFTAFNATALHEKYFWVGDKLDGKNTALSFSNAGWDFLVINIEYHADDTVLQWANELLDAYPNFHAIVATHAYLSENCTYDDWANHFRNTLLTPHSNVFMTLNGHYNGLNRANRTHVDNRNEIYFNYQWGGYLQDSTLRILTFSPQNSTIEVKTYNPVTGEFLTDPNNQFTLDMPLHNNPNPVDETAVIPSLPSLANDGGTRSPTMPEFPSTTILFLPLLFTTIIAALVRRRLRKRNTQM